MINIIEIKDLDAPELQIYYNLNEAQLFHYFEPKPGIFIAESPKVIKRALDAGCVPMSFLMEKKHVKTQAKEILARCEKLQSQDIKQTDKMEAENGNSSMAAEHDIPVCTAECEIPVYIAEIEVLAKITGYQLTRGMLCAMYRPTLPSVEQICKNARRVAILENVVNPTNVGAIFRSAAALGMDAVLLTSACADPLYRRASRVSMGTVFQIPWTYFDKNACWPDGAMDVLHKLGYKTAAMALRDDSVSIDDEKMMAEEKLAIVLGTEGDGLADHTIADCDYTVKIPMTHGVDSLNVAAASAVAFWQLGMKCEQ
ncbi:RNA methyltransferase [Roseburia intestinalis]|jgi:tRNA G18 (ribose-2'-O)-methylase SpoU|uniref:RNA methyltransferase n=1 Tax=Roseburia intestinalis TaxID=166486 RepID=A0A3R6GQ21_9FIRM|nr:MULTISPECIES: RNA methyltransferase [Roseburia]RHA66931.1 RNA methyltransferase [Roseburia intestinalis]RHF95253.1 RNA methyltransferase [Roseburia sp. AM23-20]UMY99142.1 RNA methyltransferase [Roseburia rectibacter]